MGVEPDRCILGKAILGIVGIGRLGAVKEPNGNPISHAVIGERLVVSPRATCISLNRQDLVCAVVTPIRSQRRRGLRH